MTVREMIAEAQREILGADISPERARALLHRLSALVGNINAEIREADAAYNVVLLGFLDTETKANRAKIRSECSPEYQRKREARDAKECVVDLIASLKYQIKSLSDEMRLSGGQQ